MILLAIHLMNWEGPLGLRVAYVQISVSGYPNTKRRKVRRARAAVSDRISFTYGTSQARVRKQQQLRTFN